MQKKKKNVKSKTCWENGKVRILLVEIFFKYINGFCKEQTKKKVNGLITNFFMYFLYLFFLEKMTLKRTYYLFCECLLFGYQVKLLTFQTSFLFFHFIDYIISFKVILMSIHAELRRFIWSFFLDPTLNPPKNLCLNVSAKPKLILSD